MKSCHGRQGKWLASSGAPAAVLWPFQGKKCDQARRRWSSARGNIMVTTVACHPTDDIVAIGYQDGMVLAARFADAREVLLRRKGKGAISSMMWDKDGQRLVFGTETGDCGVIDIAG